MRQFDTGATRDSDTNKFDYEGFMSPFVLEQFGLYMHKNRVQADGNLRDSDNWQKGIPQDQYMKSILRHVMSAWKAHRDGRFSIDDWMAIIFNAQGYVYEQLVKNGKVERTKNKNTTKDASKQDYHSGSPAEPCYSITDGKDWQVETWNNVELVDSRVSDVPV